VGLAPASGVIGARFVGAGPRTAAASVPAVLPPLVEFVPPPPEAPATDFSALASPFRSADPAIVPLLQPEVRLPPTPVERSLPVFTLTSVMPHPSRPLAVINARPRSVGDEIAPGWILTRIEGDTRQVIVTGPDGRSHRVRMSSAPTP
jgi:hypothetical protein